MIPTLIFYTLLAIAGGMCLYVFADNQNRVYGHIFVAVAAIILFFLLGTNILIGNVGDIKSVATNQTTVNSTVSYTYSTITVPYESAVVGWFLIFCGIGMILITILFVLELLNDIAEQRMGRDADDED